MDTIFSPDSAFHPDDAQPHAALRAPVESPRDDGGSAAAPGHWLHDALTLWMRGPAEAEHDLDIHPAPRRVAH